jgi:hypothetical protein
MMLIFILDTDLPSECFPAPIGIFRPAPKPA